MHTLTDISLSMWAKELTKKFFVCLCKCKNKSTLYSPSHPPTHICIYSHTHTQVDLHSKGPAPSKWIAGPIDFFFPSARPRPVSLFDLVGCYPAKPPPPPHTHTNTQPPSSSTGPRQLPGLTVPEQRVLAGKISPPCLSLPHPVLPFPASSAGLSGSSCLQNNIHCQWEVGDIEDLLALVSRTLHIQPAAQLSANTQTEKKTL